MTHNKVDFIPSCTYSEACSFSYSLSVLSLSSHPELVGMALLDTVIQAALLSAFSNILAQIIDAYQKSVHTSGGAWGIDDANGYRHR